MNGIPDRSSDLPGASPTNITAASIGPSPATVNVRVAESPHDVHPATRARTPASSIDGFGAREGIPTGYPPTVRMRLARRAHTGLHFAVQQQPGICTSAELEFDVVALAVFSVS
jgi:hypothetical protein